MFGAHRVFGDAGRDRPVHRVSLLRVGIQRAGAGICADPAGVLSGKGCAVRVPTLLLFSGSGTAAGAWMGGALYDLFGYYGPAFFCAIAANVLNLIIAVTIPGYLTARDNTAPRRLQVNAQPSMVRHHPPNLPLEPNDNFALWSRPPRPGRASRRAEIAEQHKEFLPGLR
jgi:hypothetical protein